MGANHSRAEADHLRCFESKASWTCLTHSVGNDPPNCARRTPAVLAFAWPKIKSLGSLDLRQRNIRRRYRTASRIARTVRNSSPLYRELSAHFAAALGAALPKIVCAPGRDNVRLLRLRPKRRRPRSACGGRIGNLHCCCWHILCRCRCHPFAHPATCLAARKCHVPVRRKRPGKFYRHDWRIDAFTPPFSAHEPRPWRRHARRVFHLHCRQSRRCAPASRAPTFSRLH